MPIETAISKSIWWDGPQKGDHHDQTMDCRIAFRTHVIVYYLFSILLIYLFVDLFIYPGVCICISPRGSQALI